MKHKLTGKDKRNLVKWNECRLEAGLPLLQIKIRSCNRCGIEFESIEARRCGDCKETVKRIQTFTEDDFKGAILSGYVTDGED